MFRRRRWSRIREDIGLFDGTVLVKWKRGLQCDSSPTMTPDTVGMQSVGHFSPPLRIRREIHLWGRSSGTSYPCPDGMAQGCITKTTKINGFAVNGAALLAGFYHRSVLRCGCLAERNPGVEGILAGMRVIGKES